MSGAAWPALRAEKPAAEAAPANLRLTASRATAGVPTEAELIDGCLRGQQLAQKQLYEKYAAA
jgi:hypothetical protein